MSSVDGLTSEIDSEYWNLRKHTLATYEKAVKAYNNNYHRLPVEDAVSLFEDMVRFQTFLELKQSQTRNFSGTAYYKRADSKFSEIIDLLREDKHNGTSEGESGLIHQARMIVDESRGVSSDHPHVRLGAMLYTVYKMELELIQLSHYLRLLPGLRVVSIEQKVDINNRLFKAGFKEALDYLDNAVTNVQSGSTHLKDSLVNLRQVVESVIYELRAREGFKTRKNFSADLTELSQKNPTMIDDATKVMIQVVWNYNSVTGPHIFGKVEKDDLQLVEFGFDQTYQVLERILSRLNTSSLAQAKASP